MDASYVADVYDELLTQAEIQGNVNKVNGTAVFISQLLGWIARKPVNGWVYSSNWFEYTQPVNGWVYSSNWFEYTQHENHCKNTQTLSSQYESTQMLHDKISHSSHHSVEWYSTEWRFEQRSCNRPWYIKRSLWCLVFITWDLTHSILAVTAVVPSPLCLLWWKCEDNWGVINIDCSLSVLWFIWWLHRCSL